MNLVITKVVLKVLKGARNLSLEVDPLLPVINANLAWFWYLSRQYERSWGFHAADPQNRGESFFFPGTLRFWALLTGRWKDLASRFRLQTAVHLSSNRPFVVRAELARILPGEQRKKENRSPPGSQNLLRGVERALYFTPQLRQNLSRVLGDTEGFFEIGLKRLWDARCVCRIFWLTTIW